MKKINVYLRLGSHPLHRELINFPPKGVRYRVPALTTTVKDSDLLRGLKKMFWAHYTKMRPPALYVKADDCDLIHSTDGFMILDKKPWIVDAEHVYVFSNYKINSLNYPWYRRKIIELLSSKYCKKVMPWSYAGKKSIENFFNIKKIKDKLEVVYPATRVVKTEKQKDERMRLLFVGKNFFVKGGKQLLDAFEILDREYDVELTVVSNPPEELKRKFERRKNVHFFLPNIPINELMRNYFSKSDIFVFPTYSDTFGMVLLEAMSCGLPVITNKIFAIPEIVNDGDNGFLIKPPFSVFNKDYSFRWKLFTKEWDEFIETIKRDSTIVPDIVEKTSILIESDSLRKKMSRNAKKEIDKGKFSIERRNKQLKRIYMESLY